MPNKIRFGAARSLRKRANNLKALVDVKTHPQVRLAVQSCYASLIAAADLVSVMPRLIASEVDRNDKTVKQSAARAITVAFRLKAAHDQLPELLEAATLLGSGRDVEVFRLLGKRTLNLVVAIGAKLSGVTNIADAADILSILKEAVQTGQSIKLRRDQVRAASNLLRWTDAIRLLTIGWCYSALVYLHELAGERRLTQDELLDQLIKHIAKKARRWH